MMKPTDLMKSIDVLLKSNGQIIGGQQGAIFSRQASIINITNKINGEWEEYLTGSKGWSVNCNGLYLINSHSLEELEEAFLNNKPVEVSFSIGNKNYSGMGLVVDCPITATFNDQFKYSIKVLGTGALNVFKDQSTNL